MSDRERGERDLVDDIVTALDEGRPEDALELVETARRSAVADDPVLLGLEGLAWLDLDRPDDAIARFESAVRLDPTDADLRVDLALALFRAARFDGSAAALSAIGVETEPSDRPEAIELEALLAERRDELDRADALFAKAWKVDPERFPLPVRLSRSEFESRVVAAGEQLPETFRRHLANVVVTVEPFPAEDVLLHEDPPLDPSELLGLFVGRPLNEPDAFAPGGDLPPRILIFQRNLERFAASGDDLDEQIVVTLYHELGHYLGLDEDELAAIDLE